MHEIRLIDANAEVERLKSDYCKDCTRKGNYGIFGAACTPCWVKDAVEEFEDVPTVEAEPVRHGRWIPTEYDSYADGVPVWDKWECSECGHEHSGEEDTLTAFCPDCGARMDATDTNVGGKGGAEE